MSTGKLTGAASLILMVGIAVAAFYGDAVVRFYGVMAAVCCALCLGEQVSVCPYCHRLPDGQG